MHFGFALDSSDIGLLNIDLLDTHLDLLDTDIPSKHFVCLQDVFKTSSRHAFKTSWRRLQEVFARCLGRRKIVTLKTCWRQTDVCWEARWENKRCKSFSLFKASFLKMCHYHGNSTLRIDNSIGIRLLTRLRLGLCHLNEH